ncbi:MAG: hypothetical protein ABWY51_01980 [Gaiellaceae bacterium]
MVFAALFGLAAWVSAADYPEPAGLAVLVGIALLAGGLVIRRGAVVTVGLAMLGVGYGVALVGKGLDPAAGLFAGGLAATAELAFWALEPGAEVRIARAATGRRALVVTTVALGATLFGSLLLAVVSDPVRGGTPLGIAGVLAVLAIFAVAVVLARSLRGGVS